MMLSLCIKKYAIKGFLHNIKISSDAGSSSVSLSLVSHTVTVCPQGCPQYWPEEGMLRYGPVQVECMSCSMDCDVISRLFRVCNLTRVSGLSDLLVAFM